MRCLKNSQLHITRQKDYKFIVSHARMAEPTPQSTKIKAKGHYPGTTNNNRTYLAHGSSLSKQLWQLSQPALPGLEQWLPHSPWYDLWTSLELLRANQKNSERTCKLPPTGAADCQTKSLMSKDDPAVLQDNCSLPTGWAEIICLRRQRSFRFVLPHYGQTRS